MLWNLQCAKALTRLRWALTLLMILSLCYTGNGRSVGFYFSPLTQDILQTLYSQPKLCLSNPEAVKGNRKYQVNWILKVIYHKFQSTTWFPTDRPEPLTWKEDWSRITKQKRSCHTPAPKATNVSKLRQLPGENTLKAWTDHHQGEWGPVWIFVQCTNFPIKRYAIFLWGHSDISQTCQNK